jgi:hypothetical protein
MNNDLCIHDVKYSEGLDIFLTKIIKIRSTQKIKNIKNICKTNNDVIFLKIKEIKKFLTNEQFKRIELAKYVILEFFLSDFSKNFYIENDFFLKYLYIKHYNYDFECSTIFLIKKNKLICEKHLGTGDVSSVYVYPTNIAHMTFKNKADQVIFVHNHLTDNINPSKEDINITSVLQKLFIHFSIDFHSLIVGKSGVYSIVDNKILSKY